MKQDIENIIKKNLPEPAKGIEKVIENTEQDRIYNLLNENMVIGFNQSLSQIDTSLIADEVLKVVVEKIESYKKIELLKLRSCENDKINWNYHQGKVHQLEDLLSNLSPNKENK
jgi:uncharacterized protein YktB (UPF0637 family)